MTANLWSVALYYALEAVKLDLRAQGHKWQRLTPAELSQLAHQRLIQECREWLARNG